MYKKFFLSTLLFSLSLNYPTNLFAEIRSKILQNLSNSETLKFDFEQTSLNSFETGICYIKRPHFLKCSYNDKRKKEIIVNKRTLVVLHYNKLRYSYPLSKSYFLEILDKKKFSDLAYKSTLESDNESIKMKYLDEKKGSIIIYFNNKNYELQGWEINDLTNNKTILKIKNLHKNEKIDNKIFFIPIPE